MEEKNNSEQTGKGELEKRLTNVLEAAGNKITKEQFGEAIDNAREKYDIKQEQD